MYSSESSVHLIERLVNLNPGSDESITIIRSLLPHCQELGDDDSQSFLDFLDETMSVIHTDRELYRKCLRALRKLCGLRGLLPAAYLIPEGLVGTGAGPAASGGFAEVREGTYGDKRIAIKTMKVYGNTDLQRLRKEFCKEVVIWKQLSHPNVVPFLGVSDVYSSMDIISEWMPYGNISDYLKAYPDANRMRLVVDVCKGLQYLHSFDIVHCDLKGANILVNSAQGACLTDFGLTSIVSSCNTDNVSTKVTGGVLRGTCRWMAPELLYPEAAQIPNDDRLTHSTTTDMYALSMVMVEILSGKSPFPELSNDPSVIFHVVNGMRPRQTDEMTKHGLSDEVWTIMEMCWDHEQAKRPGISFVLNRVRAVVPGLHPLERLEGFDPNSEASIDIIRAVLDNPSDMRLVNNTQMEHSRRFIAALEQAIGSTQIDEDLSKRCLDALKQIYGRSGLLPSSYLLPDPVEINHERPTFLGAVSDIYKGTCNGRAVALKQYRTSSSDSDETIRKLLFQQAAAWKSFCHPNIVPFLGFSNTRPLSIVLEWMTNGPLMNYLRANPGKNRLPLLINIGSGLEYLHLRGIVHGDLKAAHILVNANGQACITDFWLNASFASHISSQLVVPEVSRAELSADYSFSSDIYSLAMVFLQISTGDDFNAYSKLAVRVKRIRQPEIWTPKEASSHGITNDFWKLLQTCCQNNHAKRPTASSVMKTLQMHHSLVTPLRLGAQFQRKGNVEIIRRDSSGLDLERSTGNRLQRSGHRRPFPKIFCNRFFRLLIIVVVIVLIPALIVIVFLASQKRL